MWLTWRRMSAYSSRKLVTATQPVDRARPRCPQPRRNVNNQLKKRFTPTADEAHDHRSLAPIKGVERRHEDFHRRVGGEANRVEAQSRGRLLGLKGIEAPVLVEHRDNGFREDDEADGRGNRQQKCQPQAAGKLAAEPDAIACGDETRQHWQRDRREGDAKYSERQLHEAKGDREPEDRPVPSVDANMELIMTFNCTELAAMTAGPMSRRMVLTPASRQRKSGRKM